MKIKYNKYVINYAQVYFFNVCSSMKSPRRKIKFEILPAAGARFLGKKRKPRAWIKITEILVTYISDSEPV